MFIKTTTSGKYRYAQLVESYRKDGATRHKVLLNLGRIDQIENDPSFQNLARKLAELSKASLSFNPEEVSEAEVFNWGYGIYRKIWDRFDIGGILKNLSAGRKLRFDLDASAFLMACQHLLEPGSKRRTCSRQQRYMGLPVVDLNHLYRCLDILSEHKESLEEAMFFKNRNLFNMKVDVVFFDVTTFSFESVRPDGLRNFGFSKDGKFNEVQVVLAMLVDVEGRPVGYELFPGNTFEGFTLETALEKLKQRFGIERVVIVADRGLNRRINLGRIKEKGYDYIVAASLKRMKRSMRERVLDDADYADIKDGEGDTALRYKVLDHVTAFVDADGTTHPLQERLIVTYSPKRAEKDASDRGRLVAKARELLEDRSKIRASQKRGGRKYIKEEGPGGKYLLDEKAIAEDERFDGYYGILSSDPEMEPLEVLSSYHMLWKIEESFRIMKSTLEVRPIFHWTENRIKGHFVVCFLAFLLERTLEFKLKEAGESASPEEIRESINSLNFAKMTVCGEDYLVKTRAPSLANRMLRLMRMKPPKNVTSASDFSIN